MSGTDKKAALLIVAKDLFLEGWKQKSVKIPANVKSDQELDYLADAYLAFLKKLTESVNKII